jgi:hypothetical protein
LATVLPFQQPSPFCHPERTRVSYLTDFTRAAGVVLSKENHMRLTEAATCDRKSGEADLSRLAVEGFAVSLNLKPMRHSKLFSIERSAGRRASGRTSIHLLTLAAVIGLVGVLGRGGT